ncbi:MAG: pyruvate dehydrogenase (acetyl-transferring), homodimeric type, partial [Micrococcales bacterium]
MLDGPPARDGGTVENSSGLILNGLPTNLPDIDPEETEEWLEGLTEVTHERGRRRARYLMLRMLQRSYQLGVGVPNLLTTDYVNTIPPEREPFFPGDEELERKIRRLQRWNAAIMVHRAQRPGIAVGGHLSSYASSATLYEVGFNHFFRGLDHPGGGDQIFYQGHAAPGMYARAYLEGRLTETQLDGFRQERSHQGGGLPSYPHPRLLPDFWQFPTVSMGLGPINAIYQAQFNRYLHNRGIKDTSDQNVWAFLGDGEMDEPESRGLLQVAAYEGLDNLTFVVNCNLQSLDGPVRGNGKIILELEGLFRGAGWNVIKVIWGRGWDPLIDADTEGVLRTLMSSLPDGDYQTYRAESGEFIRENFFGRHPVAAKLVKDWTNDQIWQLKRGGHDYRKVYAAFDSAMRHTGQPTVILAHTIKGYGLGSNFAARNATHQMKKLALEDLKELRDLLQLPISDNDLERDPYLPPYYHPGPDDERVKYALELRRKLGGGLPNRRVRYTAPNLPGDKAFDAPRKGSGKQEVASTMAFVRILRDIMRDKKFGDRVVPIIPDEARTFGMDSFFPTAKIYNPHGQRYTAVDRNLMLSYKESTSGQIQHVGINEDGAMAAFIAAGSSYSTHGEPMIPVYVFYSMFGFQRTGDQMWAAGDQMCRGFIMGATAGRTTLTGEGLQHADGHSQLLASTNPAMVSYDPAYGYELAHIIHDGLRRMYGGDGDRGLPGRFTKRSHNVMYYLTVYNEPMVMPPEPENLDVDGLLRGLYLLSEGEGEQDISTRPQIMASGVGVPWALEAQQLLKDDWNIASDVWSVTSWNELRHDGIECDKYAFDHPDEPWPRPFVAERLEGRNGPVVATSDWMRAVPDQIRQFVPNDFESLGADGFGFSDTRAAARRYFKIDGPSTAYQVLRMMAERGECDPSLPG